MDHELMRLVEAQHGVVSATQMRHLGLPAHAFGDRARTRHWEAVTDEVLRRIGSPAGRGQTVMAAVLDAGPGAALSHSCGAGWWGVPGCLLEPVHVMRDSNSTRRPKVDVVLHTVRTVPMEWVTVLDGVPVARPDLLAMQLFAQFRYERAERYVDHLWSMRLLCGASIDRFLTAQGQRGRNGIGGLRRYRDERPGAFVPPASALEGRAIQILRDAGIRMRPQVDVGGDDWAGRVDLLHEEEPLIAEVQSNRFHRALTSREDDRVRRARLEEAGYVVVELWEDQVWFRPSEMLDTVRTGMLEARRRRLLGA
jgi:very-short-patch-repair endonuclease